MSLGSHLPAATMLIIPTQASQLILLSVLTLDTRNPMMADTATNTAVQVP